MQRFLLDTLGIPSNLSYAAVDIATYRPTVAVGSTLRDGTTDQRGDQHRRTFPWFCKLSRASVSRTPDMIKRPEDETAYFALTRRCS